MMECSLESLENSESHFKNHHRHYSNPRHLELFLRQQFETMEEKLHLPVDASQKPVPPVLSLDLLDIIMH